MIGRRNTAGGRPLPAAVGKIPEIKAGKWGKKENESKGPLTGGIAGSLGRPSCLTERTKRRTRNRIKKTEV